MEVLLDRVQGSLQHGTLLGCQVPLKVLGNVLLEEASQHCMSQPYMYSELFQLSGKENWQIHPLKP